MMSQLQCTNCWSSSLWSDGCHPALLQAVQLPTAAAAASSALLLLLLEQLQKVLQALPTHQQQQQQPPQAVMVVWRLGSTTAGLLWWGCWESPMWARAAHSMHCWARTGELLGPHMHICVCFVVTNSWLHQASS
jgi:hypothetical protein